MSEQDISQEQQDALANTLYPYARRLMMERHTDIRRKELLMEKGLTDSSALQLIRRVRNEQQQRNQNQLQEKNLEDAFKSMAIGGVICVIGLIVSITSYQAVASSSSGGSYIVAWGAVIFGGLQFLKGIYQMNE